MTETSGIALALFGDAHQDSFCSKKHHHATELPAAELRVSSIPKEEGFL
jgi:hypothetical protein